jgi:hypothetical protein
MRKAELYLSTNTSKQFPGLYYLTNLKSLAMKNVKALFSVNGFAMKMCENCLFSLRIPTLIGSFNNYVDQILPTFPKPDLPQLDNLHTTDLLLP